MEFGAGFCGDPGLPMTCENTPKTGKLPLSDSLVKTPQIPKVVQRPKPKARSPKVRRERAAGKHYRARRITE